MYDGVPCSSNASSMRAADWKTFRGMSRASLRLADFSAKAGKPMASSDHGAWLPRGDLALIARISVIDRIFIVGGGSFALATAHVAMILRACSSPSLRLW